MLLFAKLLPYLTALIIGAGLGMYGESIMDDRVLSAEKLAHVKDNEKYEKEIGDMTAAAALADEKAIADHRAQEGRIATMDEQLTKEKQAHEADNHSYTAALAVGTQRLRIAVRSCSSTSGHDLPATAGTASVDDGPAAYADVDPAVASRVFTVAGDDQREIDKLKALQGYVCSIAPDAPSCAGRSAIAPSN